MIKKKLAIKLCHWRFVFLEGDFPQMFTVSTLPFFFCYRLVTQGEASSCTRTQWCACVLGQIGREVSCWSTKGSSRKDSIKFQEIPCTHSQGIKQKIYRVQRNEFFRSVTNL